jgi:hypothetical protein
MDAERPEAAAAQQKWRQHKPTFFSFPFFFF